MTLPTASGTLDGILYRWRLALPAALGAGIDSVLWESAPGTKPIIFGPAASSGIVFRLGAAVASASIDINVEFTTTTYL